MPDQVFVMEKAHRDKLARGTSARTWAASAPSVRPARNEYDYMDPVRVQLLRQKVSRFLPVG